jgi:acyl carrier protein
MGMFLQICLSDEERTMSTKTEITLIKLWQEMFGIDEITTETDFFDIGGNSLNAIKFLSRVDNIFGPESLLPDTLFEDGRIKALAAAIDLHNV